MKEFDPKDHSERRKLIFDRVSNLILDRAYNNHVSYAGFYSRANGFTLNQCDRFLGHTIISIEKEAEEYGSKEEHDGIMQSISSLKETLYPSGVIFNGDEGNTTKPV